jgi:small nuclear ribonucleoprotein
MAMVYVGLTLNLGFLLYGNPRSKARTERIMSAVADKIFQESLSKIVLVELKGSRTIRGKLYSYDQHMNLVLEDAEDVSNPENTRNIGTIVVRGDNVVLVSPPPKR